MWWWAALGLQRVVLMLANYPHMWWKSGLLNAVLGYIQLNELSFDHNMPQDLNYNCFIMCTVPPSKLTAQRYNFYIESAERFRYYLASLPLKKCQEISFDLLWTLQSLNNELHIHAPQYSTHHQNDKPIRKEQCLILIRPSLYQLSWGNFGHVTTANDYENGQHFRLVSITVCMYPASLLVPWVNLLYRTGRFCSSASSRWSLVSNDGLHAVSEAPLPWQEWIYLKLKYMIVFLWVADMFEDDKSWHKTTDTGWTLWRHVIGFLYQVSLSNNQMNVEPLWIRQYWHNSTGLVSLRAKCPCPNQTGRLLAHWSVASVYSGPGCLRWASDDGLLPCLRAWTPNTVCSTSLSNQW